MMEIFAFRNLMISIKNMKRNCCKMDRNVQDAAVPYFYAKKQKGRFETPLHYVE